MTVRRKQGKKVVTIRVRPVGRIRAVRDALFHAQNIVSAGSHWHTLNELWRLYCAIPEDDPFMVVVEKKKRRKRASKTAK